MKTKLKNGKVVTLKPSNMVTHHGINTDFPEFDMKKYQAALEDFVVACALLGQNVTSINFFEE